MKSEEQDNLTEQDPPSKRPRLESDGSSLQFPFTQLPSGQLSPSSIALVTKSSMTGDYNYPMESTVTMNIKSLEDAQNFLQVGPRLDTVMLDTSSIRQQQHQELHVTDAEYKMEPVMQGSGDEVATKVLDSSKSINNDPQQYMYGRNLGFNEHRDSTEDVKTPATVTQEYNADTTLNVQHTPSWASPVTIGNMQLATFTQNAPHQVCSTGDMLPTLTDTTEGHKGEKEQAEVTPVGTTGDLSGEEEHDKDSVYSTDSVPPAPTIHKREYSGRTPGLGDIMMATVDEIPKRGRISNKMKPLLRFKEVSVNPQGTSNSAPLHRGPLHSNEDRVRETLFRCDKTDSADCLYLVLGTHYHCRACKAAIREEDLIAHRYVHSCLRLISDVNISQVVLNGRFCDNKKCVESKTPEAIGGFVIHMHCAHCDDILETGHSFHQHLKSCHKDVWSVCIVYNEADTAIEQCLFCRGYYETQEVLSKHMTDSHFSKFNNKEMQMYCIVCCGEDFPQVERYRIHMALEHKTLDASLFKPQNLPLKCLECGEEATGKQNMQKHVWQTHRQGENKVCNICGAIFGSLTKLREHELERHLESKYSCTDCSRAFICQMAFQKHFALVHSKNYRYFCNECSRGYQGEFQYLHHLRHSHRDNKDWEVKATKCEPGCGQSFLGEESLNKHHRVCLKYRKAVQTEGVKK